MFGFRKLEPLKALFRKNYRAAKCGHSTMRIGKITVFGETSTLQMPLNDAKGVDWCLECVAKMAIRCAWCGEPIHIGNPVTLYTPEKKDFVMPDHAVVHQKDPLQLVGCLRWDCAETGADRAGFWIPGNDGKGTVHRVPSPLELAFASGQGVVVGDLGNMQEAGNPTLFKLP